MFFQLVLRTTLEWFFLLHLLEWSRSLSLFWSLHWPVFLLFICYRSKQVASANNKINTPITPRKRFFFNRFYLSIFSVQVRGKTTFTLTFCDSLREWVKWFIGDVALIQRAIILWQPPLKIKKGSHSFTQLDLCTFLPSLLFSLYLLPLSPFSHLVWLFLRDVWSLIVVWSWFEIHVLLTFQPQSLSFFTHRVWSRLRVFVCRVFLRRLVCRHFFIPWSCISTAMSCITLYLDDLSLCCSLLCFNNNVFNFV